MNNSAKQNPPEKKIVLAISEAVLDSNYVLIQPAYGNSMFPYIRYGDTLKVKYTPINFIIPGDIIIFTISTGLVAHRVIKKTADGVQADTKLICKGDTCFGFDPVITSKQYKGRVFEIIRRGKKINLDLPYVKILHLLLARITQIIPILIFAFSKGKKISVKGRIYLRNVIERLG